MKNVLRNLAGDIGSRLIDFAPGYDFEPKCPHESLDMQVQEVAWKSDLHKFIDGLTLGDAVLLLRETEAGDHAFRTFGDPPFSQMLWMVEIFKSWITNVNVPD